ncbi:sugar-binding transcriptional regulator [Limnochorda pilosa]|uniref:Transcriptional regulator n=1 Tax=Limnochorda pilosa TaxID=1555112 RepID=A0A0K2SLQ9_LIMPI|nr:sugar-binding transcriptional regulator [Limnochorda pilosa]BAS28040.1 hypothetical protein LIP_2199 [Limnochorda pilosa]
MSPGDLTPRERELQLMVTLARLYYDEGLTQQEIASRLKMSRVRVNRLLQRARHEGIVEIRISDPMGTSHEMASELRTALGLQDAVVAPTSSEDPAELADIIGERAARYLEQILADGHLVGLGWGQTVYRTVQNLAPAAGRDLLVVPVTGGMGASDPAFRSNELARAFAEKLRARWVPLEAPFLVETVEARQVLSQQEMIRRVLELWERLDVAVVGIGAAIEQSPLLRTTHFSSQDIIDLELQGVVGDLCSRFFNRSGEPIVTDFDRRLICMELEHLHRVPRVVAVAGGLRKVSAILAAGEAGHINTLVTDRETATALLQRSRRTSEHRGAPISPRGSENAGREPGQSHGASSRLEAGEAEQEERPSASAEG